MSQLGDSNCIRTASVGAGKADTCPEIGLPRAGEGGYRPCDAVNVGASGEPQAAPNTLVEDAEYGPASSQPRRHVLFLYAASVPEQSLMESVAV